MKTEVRIIIAGDVNPPQKRVYASLDFKLLTVTCSWTIHTERIVAFSLQMWLRVRPTMLR